MTLTLAQKLIEKPLLHFGQVSLASVKALICVGGGTCSLRLRSWLPARKLKQLGEQGRKAGQMPIAESTCQGNPIIFCDTQSDVLSGKLPEVLGAVVIGVEVTVGMNDAIAHELKRPQMRPLWIIADSYSNKLGEVNARLIDSAAANVGKTEGKLSLVLHGGAKGPESRLEHDVDGDDERIAHRRNEIFPENLFKVVALAKER